MPLLKLSCANCSAPLEIGENLKRFACSYCGTEQIVERSGGIVWLRKVETAIRAVQKGTDRTAAELALVRLDRELADAQESKAALIHSADEKPGKARAYRTVVFLLSLVAGIFLFPIFLVIAFGEKLHGGHYFFWALAAIAGPIAVYQSIKIPPPDDIERDLIDINARIDQIEKDIAQNRIILNAPPT